MPREVHADTDSYTVEYDPEIDAVVHTWTAFTSGQAFRDGANELLEVFRERDTGKLLVDTSGIQAHDDEDEAWLEEEWIPKMLDAGMTHAAHVYPDSVISEMDMEEFEESIADLPYDVVFTADLGEAREWTAKQ